MKTVTTTESDLRLLKIGTCPSVSGKSTLTYHLGCDEAAGIHVRVVANSAAGFFSQEWLPLSKIDQTLSKAGSHFTSMALHALFRGKSQNNPAFLLAVLLREGVVGRSEEKPRCYQKLPSDRLMAELKALIASNTALRVADKPSKVGRSTDVKPVKPAQSKAKATDPKANPDVTGS